MWGSIQDGQLGNGMSNNNNESEMKYIAEPLYLNIGSILKVVQLVCGAGHSLILTQTNQMYSWGCNLLGQLGLGDTYNRKVPTEILSLRDKIITEVASGAGHCLALDTYGVVYSWGASADFQTG